MSDTIKGDLIIIGGHEDKKKTSSHHILSEVAKRAKQAKGPLVLVTAASQQPQEQIKEYTFIFNELGVKTIEVLDIREREDAKTEANIQKLAQASLVFFTGGDQLRISSQVGDSPVYRCMQELYLRGATIAGTSAGAAVMPETMLISGPNDESNKISALNMAPGLGFIKDVVIDSHFAERGRMGRLLGAVAQNPKNIGIGIDEDTAIVVEKGQSFRVVGSGAVYLVDGTGISYSSLSERHPEGIVTIFDAKLHILGEGDAYDLIKRHPLAVKVKS